MGNQRPAAPEGPRHRGLRLRPAHAGPGDVAYALGGRTRADGRRHRGDPRIGGVLDERQLRGLGPAGAASHDDAVRLDRRRPRVAAADAADDAPGGRNGLRAARHPGPLDGGRIHGQDRQRYHLGAARRHAPRKRWTGDPRPRRGLRLRLVCHRGFGAREASRQHQHRVAGGAHGALREPQAAASESPYPGVRGGGLGGDGDAVAALRLAPGLCRTDRAALGGDRRAAEGRTKAPECPGPG